MRAQRLAAARPGARCRAPAGRGRRAHRHRRRGFPAGETGTHHLPRHPSPAGRARGAQRRGRHDGDGHRAGARRAGLHGGDPVALLRGGRPCRAHHLRRGRRGGVCRGGTRCAAHRGGASPPGSRCPSGGDAGRCRARRGGATRARLARHQGDRGRFRPRGGGGRARVQRGGCRHCSGRRHRERGRRAGEFPGRRRARAGCAGRDGGPAPGRRSGRVDEGRVRGRFPEGAPGGAHRGRPPGHHGAGHRAPLRGSRAGGHRRDAPPPPRAAAPQRGPGRFPAPGGLAAARAIALVGRARGDSSRGSHGNRRCARLRAPRGDALRPVPCRRAARRRVALRGCSHRPRDGGARLEPLALARRPCGRPRGMAARACGGSRGERRSDDRIASRPGESSTRRAAGPGTGWRSAARPLSWASFCCSGRASSRPTRASG